MINFNSPITCKISDKLRKEYDEYLEWENLTISEDIRTHVRNCVKQYKREKRILDSEFGQKKGD